MAGNRVCGKRLGDTSDSKASGNSTRGRGRSAPFLLGAKGRHVTARLTGGQVMIGKSRTDICCTRDRFATNGRRKLRCWQIGWTERRFATLSVSDRSAVFGKKARTALFCRAGVRVAPATGRTYLSTSRRDAALRSVRCLKRQEFDRRGSLFSQQIETCVAAVTVNVRRRRADSTRLIGGDVAAGAGRTFFH